MAEEIKVRQGKSTKVKETLRVIKYALCAGSAGLIETLSFTLLNETMNWPYWPSYLIALVLSVLWNFTLNRKFTYRSANNVPKAMFQTFCFYLVFTPLTTIGGNFFAENLGVNNYVVLIGTMALNFITEYLYQRFYVFRATIDTNDVAERAGEKQLSEAERKALEAEAQKEANA
ncbi:MAG: GtrA family protein [Clostridia bacterium]|nr:GtrA family protein [Clostridia bacterium]